MRYEPHKPYNQLPLLPPRKDLETRGILKKAIAAGRALAELKGIGSTIPNQTILINTIALQEAKSSSEIENIVTTNDALFKAFSAQSSCVDAATKEVLRYPGKVLTHLRNGRSLRPTCSLNWSRRSRRTSQAYGMRPGLP